MAGEKGTRTHKKPAPPTALVHDGSATVAPDVSRQDEAPDTPVANLARHAEALANTLAELLKPLGMVKLTAAHEAALREGATLLRDAEKAWQKGWKSAGPGTVASQRDEFVKDRAALFGTLKLFATDRATHQKLSQIVGVEGDDLESDVDALIDLARKHAVELAGTEVTPTRVEALPARLEAFREARAGARKGKAAGDKKAKGDGEGTTAQALSEAGLAAPRLRNATFWGLAKLDRLVCARARYHFRDDAERLQRFGAYDTSRGSSAKAAVADNGGADNTATPSDTATPAATKTRSAKAAHKKRE